MKDGISKKSFFFGASLLILTSCAPAMQPPASQMALAEEAIEEASAAGAYEYAPLELKTARDKIDQAKAAVNAEDYVTAERLLKQAEIDAKLAEAKSTTVKSQRVVDELQKGTDLLREEIQRKQAQ